jgi:hypothetical protein
MNTQPLPTPKPAVPCPSCGCAAPMRPSYAPPGVWYCGNWLCGTEYPSNPAKNRGLAIARFSPEVQPREKQGVGE